MATQERQLFYNGEAEKAELALRVNKVLYEYGVNSLRVLRDAVRKGEGRQVIASVPERIEDRQYAIDALGEHILSGLVKEHRLSYVIQGEHNDYRSENGSTPLVYFPIDSFDNSSQYSRGLDTPPYTVVGAFYPNGEPIGGVIGDIKDNRIYLARDNRPFVVDLETGSERRIFRSERTSIKDPDITIATYLGSNEYSLPFLYHFRAMIKDMSPKGLLYAGGGAYAYGLLASGAMDAYIMFNEPCTEIDPGLPLALAAGCTVISVNQDGSFEEYRYNPDKHKEGRVPFFIAACTPQIRDEIIGYYLNSLKQ